MEVKRAYKFRFYPTPQQAEVLVRTFGCARFAYNHMLRQRTDAWFGRREKVNYNQTSAMLTVLKKTPEHAWLNEVSSVPVQQSLRHLQTAFSSFFARRAGYPAFKRKDGAQAAEYTISRVESLCRKSLRESVIFACSRATFNLALRRFAEPFCFFASLRCSFASLISFLRNVLGEATFSPVERMAK